MGRGMTEVMHPRTAGGRGRRKDDKPDSINTSTPRTTETVRARGNRVSKPEEAARRGARRRGLSTQTLTERAGTLQRALTAKRKAGSSAQSAAVTGFDSRGIPPTAAGSGTPRCRRGRVFHRDFRATSADGSWRRRVVLHTEDGGQTWAHTLRQERGLTMLILVTRRWRRSEARNHFARRTAAWRVCGENGRQLDGPER